MIFLQYKPSARLRPWIRSLWYCRAPGILQGRERVLPNGCLQIVLSLSREYLTKCGEGGEASGRHPHAIVIGVQTRYRVVETLDMEELAGIVIEPGGFAGLFRERADFLLNQTTSLESLWKQADVRDRMQEATAPVQKLNLLESLLAQSLRPDMRRRELSDHALYLFRHKGLSVAACARSIGVSERRLFQVFREQVGTGPKSWCRIRRFQAATRALHRGADVPWAELALTCGYYDQSHFANDFHAFSGVDVTTYSAIAGRWQNHVSMQ